MGHPGGGSGMTSGESGRTSSGLERVRSYLLTALHVGRLRPGERVVSVRRLASITGLNRKTVHRAYRTLVLEGLLVVRPGSGTFVAEATVPIAGRPAATGDLVSAVNRCRSEAASLGVAPDVFASFIANHLGGQMENVPVAVAECNLEQVDFMIRHLTGSLGLACRPVRLADLARDPGPAVDGMWGVVTTDCHRHEVSERVAPLGKPVFRVALDTEFPRRIIDLARRGPGLMVISDDAFAPVFRRLLVSLKASSRLVERVQLMGVEQARESLGDGAVYRWIWISPRAERTFGSHLSPAIERVRLRWSIAPAALERLRARLAMDLAVRTPRA